MQGDRCEDLRHVRGFVRMHTNHYIEQKKSIFGRTSTLITTVINNEVVIARDDRSTVANGVFTRAYFITNEKQYSRREKVTR